MITEHIKELREIKRFYEFRHRQRLGLKPQNLAPVHPEGSILYKTFASLYRQAMKNWRAGLRKLNRQIAAIDYAITIMERTMEARVLLGKRKRKEPKRYCSGCGELSPCRSDCPAGTYTIKLKSK